MGWTPLDQRKAWAEFFRDKDYQQFGQVDDESTWNGATGCTHTQVQALIRAKTGHHYTHDQLSAMIHYPWPAYNPQKRGMRWSSGELLWLVDKFDLPYKMVVYNSSLTSAIWERFKDWLTLGPVMLAMKYSHYPEWRGYQYGNLRADGKPVGFAITNGKTQLWGAEMIAHATMTLYFYKAEGRYVFASKDPNHRSPSRPESPAFDRITTTQQKAVLNSIRLLRSNNAPRPMTLLVPTRRFTPR